MNFEAAAKRIAAAGLRLTRPRTVLLRLILESTEPFSVRTLHERAQALDRHIHLATVHRNLAEFVSVGLLDELPGEEHRLYALHTANEGGAHVFCLDCKAITALASVSLEDQAALNRLLSAHGFEASAARLLLSAHCTKNRAESPTLCPDEDNTNGTR